MDAHSRCPAAVYAWRQSRRLTHKPRSCHAIMTIHIGLIGGGNISETHARAANAIPGVQIAAIYGTNAEKVDRLCREHGGKPFADYDALLSHRPMQAVILGSPSGRHAEQGIAAAQRGLHVLTEKPIDIATKRADALIDATN